MRAYLLAGLLLMAFTVSAGPRKDSSPLVKAPPSVAPCLRTCESGFAACESEPQATASLCTESRKLCFQRCDPAGLSSDTLRGTKRTADELRYRPAPPQDVRQQCRQGCQDRRAQCSRDNADEVCGAATESCYARCDNPAAKSRKRGRE